MSAGTSISQGISVDKGDGVTEFTSTQDNALIRWDSVNVNGGLLVNASGLWRIDLRRVSGVGDIKLQCGGTGFITLDITSDWQTYYIYSSSVGSNFFADVRVMVSGDVIEHRKPSTQQKPGSSTEQVPDEYIDPVAITPGDGPIATAAYASTNGNTVTDNVVTEALGTPLAEMPSLYAAPAMTNLFTYSRDLTQGAWGTPYGVTAAYDEVGLAGAPSTATTITHPGGNHRTWRYGTGGLSLLTTYTVKMYFKKGIGTDWGSIRVEAFGGVTDDRAYFNLNTGALGSVGTDLAADIEDVGNGWYACYVQFTTDGTDPSGYIAIFCADANGSIGCDVGDTSIVGNAELFEGTTIAEVKGAAPIITEGSTVTQAAVVIEYDIGNAATDNGAYYAETTDLSDSAQNIGYVAGGSSNRVFYTNLQYDNNIYAFDGTTLSLKTSARSQGTASKLGLAFDVGELKYQINANGAYGTEAAFDGFNLGTEMRLLGNSAGTSQAKVIALIRNVQRWDLPYTEAKAKIDELMA